MQLTFCVRLGADVPARLVVGTLSVGASLGLPLYLFLEVRHDEARG